MFWFDFALKGETNGLSTSVSGVNGVVKGISGIERYSSLQPSDNFTDSHLTWIEHADRLDSPDLNPTDATGSLPSGQDVTSSAIFRRSNGNRVLPRGWAGSSMVWTCTCTCWWLPRSWRNCWG